MLQTGQPLFLSKESLSHHLKDLIPDGMYPRKLENYLLMSQKNCITDWHVDCSGPGVFYHVLSGVKEMIFVEPTAQNKNAFAEYLQNNKSVMFCCVGLLFKSQNAKLKI